VQLTPISHKTKLRVFNKKLPNEAWFHDRIAKTDLADLAKTGHMMVDLIGSDLVILLSLQFRSLLKQLL
jgi:hypothetical protein